MGQTLTPDDDFLRIWKECGASPTAVADVIGIDIRNVIARRNRLETKLGIDLSSAQDRRSRIPTSAGREHAEIPNGVVMVASDAHYWPGEPTAAHRGFVKLIKELQPKAVVMNGDVLDGARISRHAPIGWESQPTLIEEIETVRDRLGEIELASGKRCKRYWPLGNHDARFETRLATVAPEYARIHGVHLKDHFSAWAGCWSLWLNENVVIKHRFKSGIHATHTGTMWAGKTMVTGHLHSLRVTPFSDYNGTRWGVDTGTLAEPYSAPFLDYTEDSPKNWRAGFAVLTFFRGKLLWPEIAAVVDEDHLDFRGKLIRI